MQQVALWAADLLQRCSATFRDELAYCWLCRCLFQEQHAVANMSILVATPGRRALPPGMCGPIVNSEGFCSTWTSRRASMRLPC